MIKDKLLAGIAKCEIGVDDAKRLNDPLYAKVLVLDDGTTRLAIITMDTVGIGGEFDLSEEFFPNLKKRLAGELNIPWVLVNASHTHTVGPMLCGEAVVRERTFDAVRQAAAELVEVKVGAGTGFEDRIMINRTLRLKNGKGWTVRQSIPSPPDEEVEKLGPVDPEIGIIRIDRLDGKPFAIVYNFACHPLIGVPGGKVTANYPGFASGVIEEMTGAMALFLQGAGGDITEAAYKDVTGPRDSRLIGEMLGWSVLKAWRNITTNQAALKVVSESVSFPRRNDIPVLLGDLKLQQEELLNSLRFISLNFKTFLPLYLKHKLSPDYPSDYSYRYLKDERLVDRDANNLENLEKYLANIEAMERLAKIQDDIATLKRHQKINLDSGQDSIPAELLALRIGDAVIVSTPVEALVEVGLNIKKASPFKPTLISAYSNGYMHYGATPEDYQRGGYEVTECFLAPEWYAIYHRAAIEMLEKLEK